MPAPAAGVAGVQPFDGTNLGAVVPSLVDFSASSPNAASTAVGTTITGLGAYRTATFFLQIQGATGGTLDIYLQYSPDGGTTWVDYAHFAQLAAGAAQINRSFTISKTGEHLTVSTVGVNLSPALAAATIIGGDWGDRFRTVYVAGAGTTLGAIETIKAVFSP